MHCFRSVAISGYTCLMEKTLILLILFSGCVGKAWAARPFVTDDARLTTAGSCQLESWIRNYSASHEVWALPACNPLGNFEVTLGGGVSRNLEQRSTTDYILQAKTLLRPLSTNDWGIGMAAGMVRHPDVNPGSNLLGNTYLIFRHLSPWRTTTSCYMVTWAGYAITQLISIMLLGERVRSCNSSPT